MQEGEFIVYRSDGDRTPGAKLLLAILVAAALSIPLFSIYLLNYDRQSQSETATKSITEGWGGQQALAGPMLVIPYKSTTSETTDEDGKKVTRVHEAARELTLSPETAEIATDIAPEHRKKSIYETVVYDAQIKGAVRFALPADLAQQGIEPGSLNLARAEIRFSVSDPQGIGANPTIKLNGVPLALKPGAGSNGGSGFYAPVDGSQLLNRAIGVTFDFGLRGTSTLNFAPKAGQTIWKVHSAWPHPNFAGNYIPVKHDIRKDGFDADYEVGNLALGESLATTTEGASHVVERLTHDASMRNQGVEVAEGAPKLATINLVQPVDLYSQVDRATKYGFLFIGFTFLALLMFDVIGGVRVSAVEYLLMGAALVLFFVLLLAFAEVIGFSAAYVVASAAIAGLNTAYSSAVLKSWRRAYFIGALLIGLYAVLYVLLSLEAFSLLIGSLLLFFALAGVMYATRKIDWSAPRQAEAAA